MEVKSGNKYTAPLERLTFVGNFCSHTHYSNRLSQTGPFLSSAKLRHLLRFNQNIYTPNNLIADNLLQPIYASINKKKIAILNDSTTFKDTPNDFYL